MRYGKVITGWFILIGILLIAAYDLAAWYFWDTQGTISYVTQIAGEQWPLLGPLVAFIAGCLYGHFFLPLKRTDFKENRHDATLQSFVYPENKK